jgi:O-antigen ligase
MIAKGTGIVEEAIRHGKVTFVFCLFCLIILPIHVEYLPPFLIAWVIFWFLENYSRLREIWNIRNLSVLLFILFIIYFVFYLAGLIYSTNINNGLLLVFRRLSIILFPIVLFYPGEYIKLKIRLLLKVFSLSTLAYVLFCFGYALFRSISLKNGVFTFSVHPPDPQLIYINYFFGTDLAVSQHTSYLSMYILFSMFIAFESFFEKQMKAKFKVLWLLSGIVLLASLYFFSSRAAIISALMLIPVYFLIHARRFKVWWSYLLIIVVSLLILVTLLLSNERMKYYFTEISGTTFEDKVLLDDRIPIWKASVSVIRDNLIFGVGVGDACEKLKKEYKDAGYTGYYYDNLNAHNQFLEVLLVSGLVGFSVFIFILGMMSYIAVKNKSLLYGIFIFMILIFFMFESILNRLAGVSFFALFSFLLIFIERGKQEISDANTQLP